MYTDLPHDLVTDLLSRIVMKYDGENHGTEDMNKNMTIHDAYDGNADVDRILVIKNRTRYLKIFHKRRVLLGSNGISSIIMASNAGGA